MEENIQQPLTDRTADRDKEFEKEAFIENIAGAVEVVMEEKLPLMLNSYIQVGSAYYAKELQRFHQLQEEYLFIVKNDIKTIEDLLRYKVTKEMRQENIQARQKELYRQNSVKKRACNTLEDIRQHQIWHMDVQSEFDSLKQEKREIKQHLKLVDECLKENLYTIGIDIADMEEGISNTVEMPEYSYGKNERVWNDSSKDTVSYNLPEELYEDKLYEERLYEENLYDMEEKTDGTDFYEAAGKEVSFVLSVANGDINESVEDIYRELISDAVMTEPVADVIEMKAEPMIEVTEETVVDKAVMRKSVTENTVTDSNAAQKN